MFHFEISGSETNDEHPENKLFILLTLIVFQFEISGQFFNDEQL